MPCGPEVVSKCSKLIEQTLPYDAKTVTKFLSYNVF